MVPQPPEYPITGTSASDTTAHSRSGRRAAVRCRDCSARHRGDRSVMAGQQHGGHIESTPAGGLGVDRRLEQPVGSGSEGVVVDGVRVAHDAGYQPGHRLDDDQHSRFPTG